MIDTHDFTRRAELDLRGSKAISPCTCQAWRSLPPEASAAFARALAFLGCQVEDTAGPSNGATREADRIAAARLMLLKLSVDSDDPKWSSEVLERLLKTVVGVPGGSIGDVMYALYGVLGDYPSELSKPLASFIKDLVVQCFTRYPELYQSVDWNRLVQRMTASASKPQLYFALHAIPPQFVSPEFAHEIATGLDSSPYREEAASAL